MRNTLIPPLLVVGLASVSPAQTKISGTSQCGKPELQYTLPVGDRPDHSFGISKTECTWLKPLEVEGLQTEEDENTTFSEVTGNSARDRTYVVGTMSNGDKVFVRPQGKSTLKDGAFQSGSGTWAYTGGTGKLKGLKGTGTFTCKANPDGTATCSIVGELSASEVNSSGERSRWSSLEGRAQSAARARSFINPRT